VTPQPFELDRPPLASWRLLVAVHRRVHVLRTLHVLPYIGVGAALAERAWPEWWQILCFVGCAVFGRGYLVAMQRVFAAPSDVANPDAEGGLPLLRVPRPVWVAFALHAVLGLVICAYVLGPLVGHLSWLLAGLVLVYARVRHRTGLSHLLLGLGLGAGPLGAWIALRGSLGEGSLCVVLVAAGVVAWATGFDMLFSLDPELRRPRTHGRPRSAGRCA
jgi:4-hydroxybenzoate polyprenyltransferase